MKNIFQHHRMDTSHTGEKLVDNFGRTINYLRLAVTDRCNLRCVYCMPTGGMPFVSHAEILSYEEILRIIKVAADLGITKIRLTGGEPFVRRDFIKLLGKISSSKGIEYLHITTNGVAVAEHVGYLKDLGISGINLSLDSLRSERFQKITNRDYFANVMLCLEKIVEANIPLKINTVVQEGINTDELPELAKLAKSKAVAVRFIEQMPFNGAGKTIKNRWRSSEIRLKLQEYFPALQKDEEVGTADLYSIPGFKGKVGIIGAYSRKFCDRCNKIRITSKGMLKNCLYDNGSLDLKNILRSGSTDEDIKRSIIEALQTKPKNGYTAEAANWHEKDSMSAIGG